MTANMNFLRRAKTLLTYPAAAEALVSALPYLKYLAFPNHKLASRYSRDDPPPRGPPRAAALGLRHHIDDYAPPGCLQATQADQERSVRPPPKTAD
ncbi:hypothetical protein H0H81_010533 [Sphagnurus paluster]|uniref:Uncharacterized protein n=1 Tax=Sphagnurus paluster TaxID=117069 RepID=A0A9P7FRH9_9AGAR|nr:hypothetical protein H0H81_010533 [Sphagnurus paluster]